MSNIRRVTRRLGLRTAVAAALTVPLLGSASASAGRGDGGGGRRLDVMTFNLRFASTAEPHSWAARRPVMRELLRRAAPDVIGTQEGLFPQLRDIASDLGRRYDWIGTGRAGGSRDEFAAVFYDTERLAPAAYDHFWLSDTPEVIASNTWGGSHIRMVTWVRFRDLHADGREFYVLNTHLDSGSQYARVRAAALIGQRIAGLDRALPLVVTGDFNSAAHRNPVYGAMLDAGLVDTWDTAAERGAPYATFHGYGPLRPDGDRIDWILATPGVRADRTEVDTFSLNGRYPSDHLPVRATLRLG
ncbi:endonuclease/exonuclease/phosphatase family protein [Streptomyces sp. NBC_01571]|uniref:endonuclease/exonuclease/phosphatase family protein n=1 Tax=Streptomyces sp. NBC_01571 TaxID=2975883 RepID=UPI0022522AED|nr:endonuclease/exonuclease/phosphatase family protein [Streptomyces sp. NBC_01571]MCX4572821.1 endonuclease/exonuclease/phosphatase family protein [Streptomyces sp. NBC_01571]